MAFEVLYGHGSCTRKARSGVILTLHGPEGRFFDSILLSSFGSACHCDEIQHATPSVKNKRAQSNAFGLSLVRLWREAVVALALSFSPSPRATATQTAPRTLFLLCTKLTLTQHKMTTPIASACGLPADLPISDRSRKFYDGTYTWDSDGFTDEHGGMLNYHSSLQDCDLPTVYRGFDFMDPLARAPTPMPPMISDDDDDGQMETTMSEPQHSGKTGIATGSPAAAVESGASSPMSVKSTVSPRTPGSIRRFAIEFLANSKQRNTAHRDKNNKGSQNDITTTELEGFAHETEQGPAGHKLCRSFKYSEESPRGRNTNSNVKLPETPPDSPVTAMPGAQATTPISTTSTLSSVPSNLSDERDIGVVRMLDEMTLTKLTIIDCIRAKHTEPSQHSIKGADPNQNQGYKHSRCGSKTYQGFQKVHCEQV